MENLLKYLTLNISRLILLENSEDLRDIEEIRLRANNPIILKTTYKEIIIHYRPSTQEMLQILSNICENSIYSYQNEICEGYITLEGGHRVGITGNVIMKEGQVININYIYSLNVRVAKQMYESSSKILKYILDIDNNSIKNTLIVAPPGAGKTTIIRDIARKLSNGIKEINYKGIDVAIIDERGEIAAMNKGVPQNNIGIRTDVLSNISKTIGLKMVVRSMAPKVVIADEIGNKEDAEIITYAVCSGVKGIFTAHGYNIEDLMKNPELRKLIKTNIFDVIIFLDDKNKGDIKSIKEKTVCI